MHTGTDTGKTAFHIKSEKLNRQSRIQSAGLKDSKFKCKIFIKFCCIPGASTGTYAPGLRSRSRQGAAFLPGAANRRVRSGSDSGSGFSSCSYYKSENYLENKVYEAGC